MNNENKEFVGVMKRLVAELTKVANAIPKQIQLLGASTNEAVEDNKRAAQIFVELAESQIAFSEDQQKKMFKYVSDGKKDVASFKKFLVDELKLTEQLSEKYTEIYDLTDSQLDLSKKLSSIRDKSYTKTKEYLSDVEKLSDLLHDENKFLIKNNVLGDALVSQLNARLKSQHSLNRAFDIQSSVVEDIKGQLSMIDESIGDIGSRTFQINGVANLNSDKLIVEIDKIKSNIQNLLDDEIKSLTNKLETVSVSDSGYQLAADGNVQEKGTKKAVVGDELKSANKAIAERTALYKSLINAQTEESLFNDKRFKSLTAAQQVEVKLMYSTKQKIASYRKMADLNSSNLKYLMGYRPALRAAKVAGDGFVGSLHKMSEELPSGLKYILQIDDGIKGVSAANTAAMGKFISEIKKSGSVVKATGKAFGTWSIGIKSSFSLIGASALVLGGVYKMATHLNEEYKEIGDHLGMSAVQGKKLYNINKATVMSAENQYTTMESLLGIQAEYLKETGLIGAMTTSSGQKTMRTMDEIAQAYSLNAESAVGAMNKFMQLGLSMEDAKKMVASLSDAAEVSGFDPEALTKDLIDGADIASTYYGGMAKDAARAALATKKMGLSLRQAGSVAEKMLNFDSFMTDMYELQAMGGPDLSKAFEFGVSGDLEQMTNELVRATGGLDEFNKMDFLTKKKMASTVGMTVDELSKTLSIEKQIANLSKDAQRDIKGNVDAYGDLRDITEEEYRKRKASIDATAKLGTAVDKIKLAFVKGIQPAVTAFSEMLENSSPIINGIVSMFSGVAYVLKGISTAIGWIFKSVSAVGGLLNKWLHPVDETGRAVETIRASVGGMANGASMITNEFSNISKIGMGVGAIIASWWSAKKVIGFGKSVVGIFDTIKTNVGSVTDMIGNTVKKKSTSKQILDSVSESKGGLAGAIMDTVKGTVGGDDTSPINNMEKTGSKAKSIVDTVTGWVTTFLESAKKWVASLRGIVSEVSSMGVQLVEKLGSAITSMSTTITKIGSQLVGLMSNLLKSLGSSVGSIVESVLTGIGNGLKSLGSPHAMLGIAALSVFALAAGAAIRIAGPALSELGDMISSVVGSVGGLVGTLGVALKDIVTGISGGIATIITSIGSSLATTFATMSAVDPNHLLALSGGIAAVSAALLGLGAGTAASGLGSFISKIFDDDPIKKLQSIADMANPLTIVANAVNMLGDSIKVLSDNLTSVDFDNFGDIAIPAMAVNSSGTGVDASPFMSRKVSRSTPSEPQISSNGQFNNIPTSVPKVEVIQNSDSGPSQYNTSNVISTKTMERILTSILNAVVETNSRPLAIHFDDGVIKYLNNRNKALNNNK